MAQQQEFEEGEREGSIDLRHYWNIIKKRRWVILATTVIVTALAVALTLRKPKIYQATATVIVEPFAPNVFGQAGAEVVQLGSGSPWISTEYFNTQIRLIQSRYLARLVVTEHNLAHDKRLVPSATPDMSERDLVDLATVILRSKVGVNVAKESRVFEISIQHTDPKLATELVNLIMRTYIAQNVGFKQSTTSAGREQVGQELQRAADELKKSEDALVSYKENNKLLDVSLQNQQNQTMASLQTFRQEADLARGELDTLTAKRGAINTLLGSGKKKAGKDVTKEAVAGASDAGAACDDLVSIDSVVTSIPAELTLEATTITSLAAQVTAEQIKLNELKERYGPKMGLVIQQCARVKSAQAALDGRLAAILRGVDASIASARAKLASAEGRFQEYRAKALELAAKEKDYNELVRESQIAEKAYIQLKARQKESQLQASDLANNIRELDEARVPTVPVSPNVRLAGLIGLALGLMLALGLAFLIEFLDRSVKSQEDIEQIIGLPFLGMVPSLDGPGDGKGPPELFIARQPQSTIAECCRVVRTNILFSSPDKPIRTLLVTSSNPVEGKTTNVVNLGIVMAQSGHRTLLVDTDMRRPRLHKALGMGNENGLSRVIVGESTLEDAVKSTEVPNLFLLPCGPIPPNPAELLQTEKFAAFAEMLKTKFDRIIFDSPPVLAVTDAAVLSRVADGAVIVVRAGRTARDAVIRSKRAVQSVNRRIIGVILNDVNLKNPHYASYYHYYQYKPHETAPSKT